MGLGTGATVIIAQYYGAAKFERIRKATRTVLVMEIGAGIIVGLVIVFGSPVLLGFFTDSKEVIKIGSDMAWMMAPFYAIFAIPEILSSTLRAENDVMFGTVTNLLFAFAANFELGYVEVRRRL